MATNPRLIDLTGHRFGQWTVIRKAGNSPKGAALWLCACACGNESEVSGSDLRRGKSTRCKSCRASAAFTTHGATGTRLYRIWKAIHTRCSNPNYAGYKDYGGRGIAVCSEWADFECFQQWAIANGYREDLSIEREDNNLGYGPSNCVWATPTTQSRNRRFVAKATDGRPWSAVARDNGITSSAYRSRLHAGWTHELAATWPMHKRRPGHEHRRDEHGRFA